MPALFLNQAFNTRVISFALLASNAGMGPRLRGDDELEKHALPSVSPSECVQSIQSEGDLTREAHPEMNNGPTGRRDARFRWSVMTLGGVYASKLSVLSKVVSKVLCH